MVPLAYVSADVETVCFYKEIDYEKKRKCTVTNTLKEDKAMSIQTIRKIKKCSNTLYRAISLTAITTLPAMAEITLYESDNTSVKVDVLLNTFYVNADDDVADKQESRVKIGFLPNILGFNFSNQMSNGLKLGGRVSFWTSSSDSRRQGLSGVESQSSLTIGHIDTRQIYGTVEGNFGEILFGKDFGLFARSNILKDEMLLGFGNNGLFVENSFVSYGNIGAGYLYPVPTSQITWRSKELFGDFNVAVGIQDPEKLASGGQSEESAPRLEGELSYDLGIGSAWLGFTSQESESLVGGEDIESTGVSYGVQLNAGGFRATASGFTGEGLGGLVNTANILSDSIVDAEGDERESSGYLGQVSYTAGRNRFVVSYGHNEVEGDSGGDDYYDSDVKGVVWFHDFTEKGNLKLVAEYNVSEVSVSGDKLADVGTVAVGMVLTF